MLEAYNAMLVNALTAGATIAAAAVVIVVALSIIMLAIMMPFALYAWIRYRLNPPEDRTEAVLRQIRSYRRRAFLERRAKRHRQSAAA